MPSPPMNRGSKHADPLPLQLGFLFRQVALHIGLKQSTTHALELPLGGENEGHWFGQVCFLRKHGLFFWKHVFVSDAASSCTMTAHA